MKFVLRIVLLCLLVGVAHAETLSESNIKAMLAAVTDAANKRDVDGILKHMGPNASMKLEARGPGGQRQRLVMNREQYGTYLRQSFAQITKYKMTYELTEISIAPDGKSAAVQARTKEVAEIDGNTVVGKFDETATIGLQDGKPIMTKVEAVLK